MRVTITRQLHSLHTWHKLHQSRAFYVSASAFQAQITPPSSTARGTRAKFNLRVDAVPIVYHPMYSAPQLPKGHRFPMQVFRRIYDRLLADKIIVEDQVHIPSEFPSREVLHLVHDPHYIAAFLEGRLDNQIMRRIGFGEVTNTEVLIQRTLSEVAGTLLTAELALQYGMAVSCAGGTHHAFPDTGSGFCIINDLAVTTEVLLQRPDVDRILILDLDVHQGDGTARIFQARNDVFTLSVHAASNFPARKETSHLDVALADNTGDDEYLERVSAALVQVLNSFKPDLVLYDAGCDVHIDDSLGRLAITDDGLRRRELLVLDTCLGAGIPVAGYVGGGYHEDLDVLADRHMWLHKAASELWYDHCCTFSFTPREY